MQGAEREGVVWGVKTGHAAAILVNFGFSFCYFLFKKSKSAELKEFSVSFCVGGAAPGRRARTLQAHHWSTGVTWGAGMEEGVFGEFWDEIGSVKELFRN